MKYNYKGQVGYYVYHGTMEVSRKLKYQPYAQAGIVVDSEYNQTLYSYDSKIATLSPNGILTVYPGFNFSRTTAKHVSSFLKEFNTNLTYSVIKSHLKDFKDGALKIDINTLELVGE